jgi:hypothetical protein
MEPSPTFKWPDEALGWPPRDWWIVEGTRLGLDEAKIRFIATLAQLSADDPTRAKKNSEAAQIAGLEGGREKTFRIARSVATRRLLDAAMKIKTGREPPITPQEIDRIVTRLMRSPVASEAAKGIELHDKRAAERRASQPVNEDPAETLKLIAGVSVELAAELAVTEGLDVTIAVDDAMRAKMEEAQFTAARNWIQRHPNRARDMLAQLGGTNGSGGTDAAA